MTRQATVWTEGRCYDLVRDLYATIGIELPAFQWNGERTTRALKRFQGLYSYVDNPRTGDVMLWFDGNRMVHHIAVVVGDWIVGVEKGGIKRYTLAQLMQKPLRIMRYVGPGAEVFDA